MRYFGFGKTVGALKKLPFTFSEVASDSVSLPNLLISMSTPQTLIDGADVVIAMDVAAASHPYLKLD